MGFGAPELILVLLTVLMLFGYKKLPDASRSLGRALRIFKGEMKGMKEDDQRTTGPAQDRSMPAPDVLPRNSAAGINGSPAPDHRVAAHVAHPATAASTGTGGRGETA